MSLMSPSIGDLVDRFSILRLKIHHGEMAGKNVAHFEKERLAILDHLPPGFDFEAPLVQDLSFVNESLWELTDAMRDAVAGGLKAQPLQATFGRIILRFNDKRARLIQQISAIYGDDRMEKL